MSLVFHVKTDNKRKVHTLAFGHSSGNIFVAWSKPNTKMGEIFSRSEGFKTSSKRLERLEKYYNGKKENITMTVIPQIVKKSISEYLPRARRYFKSSTENDKVIIWGFNDDDAEVNQIPKLRDPV